MKKDIMNIPLEDVENIINDYLKEYERDNIWEIKCFIRDLFPSNILFSEIIVENYGTDIRITNVNDRWRFKSIHLRYKRVSDKSRSRMVFYKAEFEKDETTKTLQDIVNFFRECNNKKRVEEEDIFNEVKAILKAHNMAYSDFIKLNLKIAKLGFKYREMLGESDEK